ncbi:mCG146017, partial [Mus musculus]
EPRNALSKLLLPYTDLDIIRGTACLEIWSPVLQYSNYMALRKSVSLFELQFSNFQTERCGYCIQSLR